jgi:ubiquinone/menaquinone biosynthesis C-methylase UbiE
MDESILKQIAQQLKKPEGDTGVQVGTKMNSGNQIINTLAIKNLEVSQKDHVLEIGMGNGFFVKDILSDASVRYMGCDYSEIMVEEARKINHEFILAEQADFLLGTADRLPFPDNTFDKILSVNTIYFWNDPEKELSEIRRVLKADGILVLGLRPKSTMQYYPFVQYGFTMFTKEEVSEILIKNGFIINSLVENEEPEQEVFGAKVKVESLIISARIG